MYQPCSERSGRSSRRELVASRRLRSTGSITSGSHLLSCLRTQSSLQQRAFIQSKRTPHGHAHNADPRGVLASLGSQHARSRRRKSCTATQRMLQNDVLENGIFKPRPKLTQSSSRLARLTPSQLVGDGGAVDGRRSGRLQLAVEGIITASAASPKV